MYDTKPNRRVAIIVETTRSYGRRIMEGIADFLQETTQPWQIFVEPRALYDPMPRWLRTWKGDGIILRTQDEDVWEFVQQTGIPIVNLKGTYGGDPHFPDFSTNRYVVGQMAAEHFLERQFSHFAFLGVPGCSWSDLEYQGFSNTLTEYGFEVSQFEHKINIAQTYRDGAMEEEIDAIGAWLKGLRLPVAILAADDFLGVQLLSACYQAQIKVPDMAAVLGVGDEQTICRMTLPTLSSVRPNDILLGKKAAQLLDRLMNGENLTRSSELIDPLNISVRHSSEVMAVEDELVMKGLAFIREHVDEGINAADVINILAVSKSVAQRRFLTALGRSIYETIIDQRLRKVMELLSNTNLTVRAIARMSGFKHVEHMNNLFKSKLGVTPVVYRKNA